MIKVDESRCIGCGACVAIDPNHFDFNENGLSTVINNNVDGTAKEACDACPVSAIEITDEENVVENPVENETEV